MKRLFSSLILLLCCLTGTRCGTETGNPNVTPPSLGGVDLSNAVMFFSGTTEVTGNAKLKTRALTQIRGQSGNAGDYSDASLLKLTFSGKVEPAVRVKDTLTEPPTVLRMAKIGDDYFLLLENALKVGEEACTLVRVSQGESAQCIDSQDHPAESRAENGKLTFPNDQIQFLVAEKNGGILYRDANHQLQFFGAAGIQRFGPSSWTFETNFQTQDGSVYGLGCVNTQTDQKYLECRISQGSVTVYSDAVTNDRRLMPLEQDQILVLGDSADPQSLHLHEGPAGVTVNATNFSTDYTPGLTNSELEITENIISVFLIPIPILWAGTYAVSESNDHSVCVYELGEGTIATGRNCADTGYNTFGGIDFQASTAKMIFSWMKDSTTCELLRYKLTDPPGSPISKWYLKLLDCGDMEALPETIRFMDKNVFVFGGRKKGANSSGYLYYRYDLSTGQYELLLTSSQSLVFFPL